MPVYPLVLRGQVAQAADITRRSDKGEGLSAGRTAINDFTDIDQCCRRGIAGSCPLDDLGTAAAQCALSKGRGLLRGPGMHNEIHLPGFQQVECERGERTPGGPEKTNLRIRRPGIGHPSPDTPGPVLEAVFLDQVLGQSFNPGPRTQAVYKRHGFLIQNTLRHRPLRQVIDHAHPDPVLPGNTLAQPAADTHGILDDPGKPHGGVQALLDRGQVAVTDTYRTFATAALAGSHAHFC